MEVLLTVLAVCVVIGFIQDYREKGQMVSQLTSVVQKYRDREKEDALDLQLRSSSRYQILLKEKQYYENEYKKLSNVDSLEKKCTNQEASYKTMYENLYEMYMGLEKENRSIKGAFRSVESRKEPSLVGTKEHSKDNLEELERKCRERLELFNDIVQNKEEELSKRETELVARTSKQEAEIQSKFKEIEQVKKLCDEQFKASPWLASLYADYVEATTIAVGDYLIEKKNPAYKAADLVKEVAKEQRKWVQIAKIYQYTMSYYESLIPSLPELLDFSAEEELPGLNKTIAGTEDDPVRKWLSSDEYRKLPTVERNQLSLDRYLGRKRKTKREIGREYERYIGYCYEKDGYKVQYRGIIDGFEDLGRDLICINSDHVVIVQCKCWSADKVIREKHINQLYGTSVMYAVENGLNGGQEGLFDPKYGKVRTRLITSTELSPIARKFADYLGVEYEENHKHGEYPVVKCNINRQTNEKIYHLPFDQLYDRVDIEKERGEFYAWTVKDAEDAGFRRAMRWHGEKNVCV